MRFRIGDRVEYGGKVGTVTDVRYDKYPSDDITDGSYCPHNPKTKLPDYVEIDGEIQVHPTRVRRVR